MTNPRLRLKLLLACGIATALTFWPTASASAAGSESLQPSTSTQLTKSLVVPGTLDEGEQRQAAEDARRATPEAAAARQASQDAYRDLGPEAAKRIDRSAFGPLVTEPDGGPPHLSGGERISGYISEYAAQVDLPDGRHGALESVQPIALQSSASGHRDAIDLHLSEVGGSFEPGNAAVNVRVPRHLADGVQLARTGIALTPVTQSGSAFSGATGEVDGASVIYPDVQTDADTVAKPTTLGFSLETLLRSQASPHQLFFRATLPAGATLASAKDSSGAIDVQFAGASIARIPSPSAQDAEGASVPVTMSVSGDLLTLTLPDSFTPYHLPIAVDPTVEDNVWQNEHYFGTYYRTEWSFLHSGPAFTAPEHPEAGLWSMNIAQSHVEGEYGGLFYTTRGASEITVAHVEGEWANLGGHLQGDVLLQTPKYPYTEDYTSLPEVTEAGRSFGGYACKPSLGCAGTTAGTATPENGNTAGFVQYSTGSGTDKSYDKVTKAYVDISQEQGPELHYNTTEPTIFNPATSENVANVLWGGGSWLGPHSGAFEVKADDPGLGLKYYRVAAPGGWADRKEYYGNGECYGVQCPAYNHQGYAYETGMADGEVGFEAFTEDPVGLLKNIYPQTIKVDGTAPHEISVSGFQTGSELPLGETTLKVTAKDGSGTTKSSGLKSIKVKIDGKEAPGTAVSCSPGPCTATSEVTVAARNYSNGEHSLVVSATDNANNLAQENFNFWVHGASPVAVGPGTFDPSTGQLTISASDVTPGGGIGVSRTYESLEPQNHTEGPLGPQWKLNLGGSEGLTTLIGGDAIVSASSGADTTFLAKGHGEFESPPGDGNLKLEAKEAVPTKGITEYVLKDEKAGTKTKFEQPSSLQNTAPTFEGVFGEEPSQLSHPLSLAVDPSGNLWTTNAQSDLIEKFTPDGTLLATYGSYGGGGTQFSVPWGIGIDPRNGNVYISDQGNNRVQELSSTGVFLKTFGWGVKDGQPELETCTEKCRPGIAGTSSGEFANVAGLAVDASGNLWIADYGNNRIQEFNEKAEFVRKFGSLGTGESQFNGPLDITLSGGNLYITDYGNNRVQELSSVGTPIARFSECTGGPGGLLKPYGIAADPNSGNLYIVDQGHSRVQECSATHAFITQFGSAGSGPGQFSLPSGAAVGGSGEVYALDYSASRIEQWARPNWIPTEAGGPLSASTTTFAYTVVEREGKPQIEPTEALSPVPAGVSCGTQASELKRGCRALTFTYAEHTTASESEWSDYQGDLSRVYYHAWDPAKGEMTETAIAQYSYDNKGRLRAEWDPRIALALKTVYGYDQEGHLTALSPPGEEPWAFNYGKLPGDATAGRIFSVARAGASGPLGVTEVSKNTTKPSLSTASPLVGEPVKVNHGAWSNSPVTYSYAWDDCKLENDTSRCKAIPGAVNSTYTPLASDRGYKLEVFVKAFNAIGSTSACASPQVLCGRGPTVGGVSELSVEPPPPAPEPEGNSVWTIDYGIPVSGSKAPYALGASEAKTWGQEKDLPVEGVAIFPPSEPMGWPAAVYKQATVHYFDNEGRMVNTALPTGGIATTEYNATNDVIRTLSADNRATALTETGKTVEAATLLDTKSEYDALGTELLQTRGPRHTVKLTSGAAVQAREHVHYFYDEGAPMGQSFGLVTKRTDGAEYEGKEADIRTTLTSYQGQEGLGWTLRKPTSTTADPAGLDLVTKTAYDKTTGNVVETRAPGGNSETIYPPAFAAAFASEGSGNGQLNEPRGVATDASGNIWVVDQNNNRVEKFSPARTWIASYGTKGTGNLQFEKPWGIAINPSTGNLYVSDRGNNRIQELSSAGTWVASFGTSGEGALKEPTGVALDVSGNLFVSDKANNRVVEFGPTGSFIRAFGTLGSGNGQLSAPLGIAISEGSVYVVDSANSRIEQFSPNGTYIGQFGSNGAGAGQFKEAVGIAANPSTGVLYVADLSNARISEFSPAGRLLAEWGTWGPKHENSSPNNVAVAANGTLYDSNLHSGQVLTWTPPEAGAAKLNYNSQFGSSGSGNGQFSSPRYTALDGEGNVWATDCGNNRVEKFSAKGAFITAYGKGGSGEVQFSCPTGIDINQSTGNVYVSDSENHRIEQLTSTGSYVRSFGTSGSCTLSKPGGLKIDSAGNVWVPDLSANKICEFSSSGAFIGTYGSEGSGEVQFKKPVALAFSGENLYVTDQLNHRVEELSNKGAYVRAWGIEGKGSGEFYAPEGIATDAAGNLYVVDDGASHVEEFTSSGVYRGTFGAGGTGEGQLKGPVGDSIDAAGNLYVVDNENNRVVKWSYANPAIGYTKNVYYSVGANSEYANCGNHPEWANTPCETLPAAQPNTPGVPNLPVTSVAYDIWGLPEAITETFGSMTRFKKETFDAAGRALTSEVTSSAGTPLPRVTNEYNPSTGALEKQSMTTEGGTKTITSVANRLGQLEYYTDADGVRSTYKYDEDGRPSEVNYGEVAGTSASQMYSYDSTTGLLSSLYDTSAGTFTAKDDAEGKLSSETYPNGMKASYTLNGAGEATGIEYVKTTHCTSSCTWFSDVITPAIHGETMKQTSSLAEGPSYTYDSVGRVTQVQEVPSGKGCTTRLYSYDEEGDRTGTTTREPATGGACASEGGTREAHIYDPAGRLADAGTSYDAFGNLTALPASDAGGHELKSTYYVDNQVASQEQQEEGKTKAINLVYDPAGRIRESLVTGKLGAIAHYAGDGEALSWTTEGASLWTRNIPGIDGTLCATQASGQAPVLQLHDLQGNVIATASLSETETKLLSSYSSTEFGVPQSGSGTQKYSWLGATGLKSELPASGVVTTGERSYVPEIGRPLQSEQVASPGAFPDGTGGRGIVQATYLDAAMLQFKAIALEEEAAHESAARKEAEDKAFWEQCPASECHVDGPGEGNCEVSCGTVIEETGDEILGTFTFTPTGGNAHAADVIHCVLKYDGYPHRSSHYPDTVNWSVKLICTGIVLNVRMRLALFWDGGELAETGYIYRGSTALASANVSATCISGWFQGWAYADLTPPPGFVGNTRSGGYSPLRYVQC